MGGGQHELELHHTGVVLQLAVLDAVQLVGNVRPSNVHLVKEKPNQLPVLRRQKEEKDKGQIKRDHNNIRDNSYLQMNTKIKNTIQLEEFKYHYVRKATPVASNHKVQGGPTTSSDSSFTFHPSNHASLLQAEKIICI